ncbi:MAG: hypothetical protein J5765_02165 [Clostridia bacterium]|nr:hypothetical protein [Clostridia bacterium]
MAEDRKRGKASGFNVHTPKVGLYPAGSIVGVKGGKVILRGEKKPARKKG